MGMRSLLILYPLQAISLFLMTYKLTESNINTTITKQLGNLSATIYFLHTVFIYGVIDYFFGIDAPVFLKFFLSIVMSVAVYLVAMKFKIKPVKWLIGSK